MSDSRRRLSQIEKQFHGSAPAYRDSDAENMDTMTSAAPPPRPAFSDLPLDKKGPGRNCWGLFGPGDELGQLNYITPEVTKEASKEIVHGIRIPLDLPLNYFEPPSFARMALKHEIINLGPVAHDDIIHFNTQGSTQWDGFRHVGYPSKQWYGGVSREEIHASTKIGTHAWAQAGGFATRGVLLDYRAYMEAQGLTASKSPFERTSITLSDLQAIARSQNVTLRTGDVLMVRTGFLADYPSLQHSTRAERHTAEGAPTIGLEQSEGILKWLWDSGIVAAAADCPALEAWPMPPGDPNSLHFNLLAGWGMPIGEFFDLEKLAEECKRTGKWSFFFTSMPLNMPGGVGSPVNGIAIL